MASSIVDHYAVLGVGRDANLAEIKAAFRARSFQLHPDKRGDDGNASPGDRARLDDEYRACHRAWTVLRNDEWRQRYDALLGQASLAQEVVYTDHVPIDDLTFYDDGPQAVWKYPCRCGEAYSVTNAEVWVAASLCQPSVAAYCTGCSLVLGVEDLAEHFLRGSTSSSSSSSSSSS